MSLPDINFEQIRPHHGSRDIGFEELCSQLAALEPMPTGSSFHRKGRGGDAGVECYWKNTDGSEKGWQAKYLYAWNPSLQSQLDESISIALTKHPRLTEYVVCLPFDLPDARKANAKSAQEKWHGWCAKWKITAAAKGRALEIRLWGQSELASRLARDTAETGGRLLYWFGDEPFSRTWLSDQFNRTKASLGARYTPETNVELSIRRDFLAFARDPDLQKQIDGWMICVSNEGRSAVEDLKRAAEDEADPHSDGLKAAIDRLAAAFGAEPIGPDQLYPLDAWRNGAIDCLNRVREALLWAYKLPPSKTKNAAGTEPRRWAETSLQKLMSVLSEVEDAVCSCRWQLANARAVLLTGSAGIGKSHLLADIVEHLVHASRPAVLILGSSLRDDDPWRQILAQLDRPSNEQVKHFLGGLDAAAEAAGTRAIICIDALNERHGLDIWPDRLAAFLHTAQDFPRVGVILSCRSTYVRYLIPDSLGTDVLMRVEHEGFATDGGEAAKIYLDKRGIVRPGAPNLVPEFENPLFLKTCCDFLEKEGKREMPRGLRGITAIFDFYNNAVTRALNQRMQLDTHFNIVPRAISEFSRLVAASGVGYVEKTEAITVFESINPSQGNVSKSLLSQLESEGLLTIEPLPGNGSSIEFVRFTFERFSDHAIARRLLSEHLNRQEVASSFAVDTPLNEFVFGPKNYRRSGIIEALAVQLPEQTGVELLDVGGRVNWPIKKAFHASLLWREQTHFTDRTFDLAHQHLNGTELNELMIAISTEPQNKFNAVYIHGILKPQTMPERDRKWSVFLAEQGYSGGIETLIDWALHNGFELIDEDRACLAGMMLSWFLTTSNRIVRDKATKALACLLAKRLRLAARLVRDFASVNDPYLQERLLCACYGAALQGNVEGLDELAGVAFEIVLAAEAPPPDALLRDHANGIIEYANWHGLLPLGLKISAARPPYKSAWPIAYVSKALIETYKVTNDRGTFCDAIVWSTLKFFGDFGNYQIDHKVDRWSPAPLGTWPLPHSAEIYEAWHKDFNRCASGAEKRAFRNLFATAREAEKFGDYKATPEIERRTAALAAFRAMLTPEQWDDFEIRAENHVLRGQLRERGGASPVHFDIPWARRWICKRAHDLGWTAERFMEFDDRMRGHGRNDHAVERVGKKYQWIALRELIARMADNLGYIGDFWEQRNGRSAYVGARQIGLRDIDPSLLATETHYDGWREWGRTWWVPHQPNLRPATPTERLAWLESDIDIINDASLIEMSNPRCDRRWLALSGFADWRGRGLCDGREEFQRDTWFRLTCMVVCKTNEAALVQGLRNQILTDPYGLPEVDLHGEFYLGEYPWHPALKEVDRWSSPGSEHGPMSVPTRPTVAKYTCERGGYDYSIDRTVSLNIPAPWLANAMELRMMNGGFPIYVDKSDREIFYDPSLREAGPAAALIDRDAFLQLLERENLSAVWIIAGEKNAYGGQDAGLGFGGRMLHTGIYKLGSTGFDRDFHSVREHPSGSQLAAFYGDAAQNLDEERDSPKAPFESTGRTRNVSRRSSVKQRTKRPDV